MRALLIRAIPPVLSCVVALAAAEVFLRACAPLPFSPAVRYEPDGYVRARLQTQQVYSLPDGGRCTVNRWGYRGRDFRVRKPEGRLRIVALGASSTFSYLTDDARIWTALLETSLREQTGRDVEVINAGVPGYSTFESKLHYLYRIRALEADAVLVYHTWNDLKHFHDLEEDFAEGELRRSSVYEDDPMRRFLRRFQLAWRLRGLLERVSGGGVRENRESGEIDSQRPIAPDGGAHRWVRENFDDLAGWIRADGALPVLISQAGLLSKETLADPEALAQVHVQYQTLSPRELLDEWRFVSETLRETAARHGALFVDGYGAVPHSLESFRDHVHLTERGNAQLAERIGQALLANPDFSARLSAAAAVRDQL